MLTKYGLILIILLIKIEYLASYNECIKSYNINLNGLQKYIFFQLTIIIKPIVLPEPVME